MTPLSRVVDQAKRVRYGRRFQLDHQKLQDPTTVHRIHPTGRVRFSPADAHQTGPAAVCHGEELRQILEMVTSAPCDKSKGAHRNVMR